MDHLVHVWNWIVANPAEAAWGAFGTLTALVGIYRLNEAKIKARVAKTATKADDKIVLVLDGIVSVFEVVRLLVPHGVARPAPAVVKEEKDA